MDGSHRIIDLTSLGALLTGPALTNASVAAPPGFNTGQPTATTVVPNRHTIMLDVAVADAIAVHADAVAFGAHAGVHTGYPDCRPEFVERFARSVRAANASLLVPGFQVLAPFLSLTKTDIVRLGDALAVPFARTWSCYRGQQVHCGTCGTCTERQEASRGNGIADPTTYRAA